MEPEPQKICRHCELGKPITEFYKHEGGKHGVGTECKPCATARHREYMARKTGREIKPSTSILYARALLAEGKKYCPGCEEVLDLEHFSTHKGKQSGGRAVYCRACVRERTRQRNARPDVKAKRKAEYQAQKEQARVCKMFRDFGLTEEDYERMLEEQDRKCMICGDPHGTSGKSLAVDHDHDSGLIRGLLCSRCNPGLGFFRDSPGLLRKAAEYLELGR
jgi:hypothetical protein